MLSCLFLFIYFGNYTGINAVPYTISRSSSHQRELLPLRVYYFIKFTSTFSMQEEMTELKKRLMFTKDGNL